MEVKVKEHNFYDSKDKEKDLPLIEKLVKCVSILDTIPEDDPISENGIDSEKNKNEILVGKTGETRSEAQTEYSESPCTNDGPEKLTDLPGHARTFDSEIKSHEGHKTEDISFERPEMFASFISHGSKDNPSIDLGTKYDDDDDFEGEVVTEKPSGKTIFSHFVKHLPSEAKAEKPTPKPKEAENASEKTKLPEIKESPSEHTPQESKKEAIFTQIIKNTMSEESHKPKDAKSYDFYTNKTSGVDSFYRKYEQEKKSATSEDIKDQDSEIFECEFSVHYETKLGDKGLSLIWHIGHRWSQTLKMSSLPFEYKYLCKSSEIKTWEGGPNRIVSEQPNEPFYDSWRTLN
jgi:hypothetical protein